MGEQLYDDPVVAICDLYRSAVDACRQLDARLVSLGLDPRTAGEVRLRVSEGEEDSGRRYIDIADTGAGSSAATTSRLLLEREHSVSAVSTLRDWVIVCPFAMTAVDLSGLGHEWKAGVLNLASTKADFDPERPPVGGSVAGVWWVDGPGAILADGVWAGRPHFGTVIDLTGALAPRLSVDRRSLLTFDEVASERLTMEAIPSALTEAWHFVGTSTWLDGAAPYSPALVDAIVAGAAERRLSIAAGSVKLVSATAGYLVGDGSVVPGSSLADLPAWWATRSIVSGAFSELSIDTEGWSLPVAAQPSDAVFLEAIESTLRGVTWQYTSPWAGDEIAVYDTERHLRWPLASIVARARELGLPVPRGADELPETSDFLRGLFERNERWDHGQARRFVAFDILLVAAEHGLSPGAADAELSARRIASDAAWPGLLRDPPTLLELLCASEGLTGAAPWCPTGVTVDLNRLNTTALAIGESPSVIAASLRRLGYSVESDLDHDIGFDSASVSAPPGTAAPDRMIEAVERLARHLGQSEENHQQVDHWPLTADDVRAVTADISFREFWHRDIPIGPLDVRDRARAVSGSENDLQARLTGLGYSFASAAYSVEELTDEERILLSREANGRAPWRQPDQIVGLVDLMVLSAHIDRPVEVVQADLRRLGHEIAASDPLLPRTRPGAGARLDSEMELAPSIYLVQRPGRPPFIARG